MGNFGRGIGTFQHQLQAISPWRATLLLCFALFLFSVAIYAGTLKNDFVWDDIGVFVEDPAIRDFRNIPGFFTSPLTLGEEKGAVGGERIRYYRPLLSVVHTVEYRWFGDRPLGYKAVNLVLNGVVVVLAFLLVREVLQRTGAAFLAALLYAAVPARAEVVYWAYSDSYLFAALCILPALIAYHRRRPWPALLGMGIALLFQEGAILLPVMLAAYEWLVVRAGREQGWGVRRLLPFALLGTGYLALRHLAAGALPVSPLPLADLLRGAAALGVRHLQVMFVPEAPVTMYLYQPGMFAAGGAAGTMMLLAAGLLVIGGVVLWKFSRGGLFWYAWFFVWIATTFNIGSYANYLMAEKTLYLAALGPCVLLAQAACSLRSGAAAGVAVLLGLVVWHASQVVARAPYWANTATYLESVTAFEPGYDVAHYQLAVIAMQAGAYQQALDRLRRVVALRPELKPALAGALAEAYAGAGRQLAEQRCFDEALAALQRSLEYDPRRSATWNALGVVNYLRGAPAQAEGNWRQAIALDPHNLEAARNLQRFAPQPGSRP